MTPQEIFNHVVNHLRKQGVPAMIGDGCRYRADDGKSCAIGCMISNDDYVPEMEGKTIGELVDLFPSTDIARFYNESEINGRLMSELQSIHDITEPKNWEREFASVAEEFNLTVPPR